MSKSFFSRTPPPFFPAKTKLITVSFAADGTSYCDRHFLENLGLEFKVQGSKV
jgi:hypothetical protein